MLGRASYALFAKDEERVQELGTAWGYRSFQPLGPKGTTHAFELDLASARRIEFQSAAAPSI
jgi:hypothetical protein